MRLRSLIKRAETARHVRWSDVRRSGAAGLAYLAAVIVSEALGLYDWLVRQAGCTNQQAHDQRYFCPSGEHVFSIWLLFAGTLALAFLAGFPAVFSRSRRQLTLLAATQLAVVAALIWISQTASYHVHVR